MPCTSFSKALIVLGVSWSMSKLESLSSLLELLVSLSESLSLSLSLVSTSASTAACSFLMKVVLMVLSLSEVVCLRLVIVEGFGAGCCGFSIASCCSSSSGRGREGWRWGRVRGFERRG